MKVHAVQMAAHGNGQTAQRGAQLVHGVILYLRRENTLDLAFRVEKLVVLILLMGPLLALSLDVPRPPALAHPEDRVALTHPADLPHRERRDPVTLAHRHGPRARGTNI